MVKSAGGCGDQELSSAFGRSKDKIGLPVADPDRCHGFQETYENCPHKFNTIYKFCSWQKQQPRT